MCKPFLKNLVLSSCLLLSSCGKNDEPYVSPDLISYVQLFESTYNIKVDFDVVISDLPIQYVGMCTSWSDGSRKIEISAKYVSTMNKSLIEETVFHELGHCVFNRDHEDSFIYVKGSYIPKSIMYSYVHTDYSKYEQNKEWYFSELANPSLVYHK